MIYRRMTTWIMVMAVGATTGVLPTYGDSDDKALATIKKSFKARGQAGMDRLDQDDAQKACSRTMAEGDVPADVAERIQKQNLADVKYPADGAFMGDWREGEKIAQSGIGMQFSDDPARPAGANCYACHQLAPGELSFGTIGPPLLGFGKSRGVGIEMQKFVFAKIYNSNAFRACSNMPRFGAKKILTEQQIKHLVGLLLDPASPVNK